ncbi:putative hydroxymethylpyrimidine transport system substrate-binding protein [Rhodobacter aestuarii]|uniref:Putative hydroxymethylpyrimidine transport system substrate-binding protein n=1 Tax=Rhodobacter aestuarii TaxID=453582 RepID=A0A1N7J089_9RHOB|nr:ABC transporter substrate-binding protein [Rhodobacter aestuarii]PTV97322.1 putative hydroxymethylpyrimidine transport system substrate-binding protein [Rhodobacter aestuarii]SIS42788.1 putative hydroxymethylpyrimidine transport system substrate-binding protein [Rhodobacter aestuarii]
MKNVLIFALALCAALPARANEPLTVMLDWFVNPDHGPIIVANARGYFAHAGLDVTIIPPADPADPPKMAAAGQVDIAVSYQPQLYLAHDAGLGLKRVGTLINSPLYCVMVDAAGPVQNMADLKGRSIGFSLAGIEEALLHRMLRFNGVDPAQTTQINVNFALTPALVAGQVEAVSGAFRNFELHQMAAAGHEGRCFLPEENGVPPYDELIYVARADLAGDARISRFLAATARAAQEIAADPAQGWADFKTHAPELDDPLNAKAWEDSWPHFARDPVALDAERYAAFGAFLAESGLIAAAPAVEAIAQ